MRMEFHASQQFIPASLELLLKCLENIQLTRLHQHLHIHLCFTFSAPSPWKSGRDRLPLHFNIQYFSLFTSVLFLKEIISSLEKFIFYISSPLGVQTTPPSHSTTHLPLSSLLLSSFLLSSLLFSPLRHRPC